MRITSITGAVNGSPCFIDIVFGQPHPESLSEAVGPQTYLAELTAIFADKHVIKLARLKVYDGGVKDCPNPVGRDVIPVSQKFLEHSLSQLPVQPSWVFS